MTRESDREPRPPRLDAADVLPLIAAIVVLVLVALLMPTAATLAGSGRLPAARPAEMIAGTVRLAAQGRWSDPASAYTETAARRMPDPDVWWTAAGGTVFALLALAALAWTRLEPAMARERLGRRPYDPRGSRPRAWARPRDLRDLTSRRRTRGGFSLGTLDRRALRTDPEAHVALIAPTRNVLAFIRHFGCPQCKTLLDNLYQLRPTLEENKLGLVVVTQGTQEETAAFCAERIPGTLCLADPTRSLYQAYGVARGGLRETFLSAEVWRANARAAKKGFKVELPPKGQDAMLMSALFVIGPDGRIRLPYYYDHIADHPPVEVLLSGFLGTRWEQPFNGAIHTEGGAHGD